MDSFYKRADVHDVIIPSFTEVEIKFHKNRLTGPPVLHCLGGDTYARIDFKLIRQFRLN